MDKIRQVIAYQNYFEDFLKKQPVKVQDKIYKVIEAIENLVLHLLLELTPFEF